ncbi:MAG: esterase [Clostridia bacterium]|nr:esterase [Clostridia bacterium]
MEKTITSGGRTVRLLGSDAPAFILIQPVDEHDGELLGSEVSQLSGLTAQPFVLAALRTRDWNAELSPWPAPPVFGKEGFAGGAGGTLAFLRGELLPALRQRFSGGPKTVLGGYSLAGLFALWAARECGAFEGVAAASPSVWYPEWEAYTAAHPMHARCVYLSLGDREEHTRNPVMARVGDRIRGEAALLRRELGDDACLMEWNEGNHFKDSDGRTARAFAWVLSRLG